MRVRAHRRPLGAAFLAVVTTLATALAPGSAAAARPASSLTWQPCAEDRTAQCATLRVPVDWSDPYGPAVGVAVARRPAADPKARIGALLVNPGGPGGSGVDFALDSTYVFGAAVRRRFDIVGFDPRGVARSNPVVCSSALLAAGPSVMISNARSYATNVAFNRRLAADCAKRTGPLYGHTDSLSVAQDMDALRAALGEQTVSFYGASYGTLLGAQYAERYPRRVRALVLDGVMDHSRNAGAFLADETAAAQDSFDEFVAWCDRSTQCAVHGRDVRALWAALLSRARRGTLRDPFDPASKLGVQELLGVALGSFYDPQWHSFGVYLREATALARRAPAPVTVAEFSFPAVFCDDWAGPADGWAGLRLRLARLSRAYPQMPVSPLGMTSIASCVGDPLTTDNPQRPLGPARTGPILVLNSRHDPATPYAWARSVADQLGPVATLVTYEGWGHTAYGRTPCVRGVVDRYLLTVVSPAAGTSCPGVEPSAGGVGAARRGYR
ncbi:alpha/beta hydrolase [Actinoplanes sp. RD1]|uniref:alpha/beta hydrolase n=1 Tax=Actinoplanes sp. RD1 TaxID=3064538 RepID=UPI002741D235|nr:alpha/beta hydrolase [Actinoplanes sp. RD1]